MSYTERFEAAEAAGKIKSMEVQLIEWEEEGQCIIGELVEYEEYQSPQYKQVCQKYLFDTDDGRISVICGVVTDRILAHPENKGNIFRIIYVGKEKGKKSGRIFNRFTVEMLTI